jgi:hypothetical protein
VASLRLVEDYETRVGTETAHATPGRAGREGYGSPDTRAGSAGIGLGGILVIVGIVLAIVWSVWIGIIIAVVGLVAFGGFAKGKWY